MDSLDLHLLSKPDLPLGSPFTQIEIRINGIPLLDLVAKAEEKPTQQEFDERVAAGEDTDGLKIEPGGYMYPTLGRLRQSGELSFGNARHHFALASDDSDFDATVLLDCACGNPGCWMLLVNAQIEGNTLSWSEFRQFHRPEWVYSLGPFRFDYAKYWQELQRVQNVA